MIQGVFLILTHVGQGRIQYFPDELGANPKGGANLWIGQFSRKLHEEKHLAPPNPPMLVLPVKSWKIVYILKLKTKNKEKHQICGTLLKMLFEKQFAMIFIHGKKYMNASDLHTRAVTSELCWSKELDLPLKRLFWVLEYHRERIHR